MSLSILVRRWKQPPSASDEKLTDGTAVRAINLFENMLSFSNHLCMFSEEISRSGEQLGNTPQAFSHLALISAAFNLDRVAESKFGDDKL
jgi:GH15 family glucan-1,4-alpha-glucosidase